MEWSLRVRCEPRSVIALDAAISAAYPDVRLGHLLGEPPQPLPGGYAHPGHVMRFRKERSFVYPLVAAGDELASPPLEADRARAGRDRRAVGRALPAHPRPGVLRGARARAATAATRTGSCARSAGDCPRAA